MKCHRPFVFVSLAAAVLLMSGCVTGRRSIELPIAESPAATAVAKGDFYLGDIIDARTFENHPDHPSTPSIDGDVSSLTPAQKASFVGRQRGGFGNAMGDVVLANDGSVTERMHALIAKGLGNHGYVVTDNPKAANSTTVTIDRFWAWTIPEAIMIQFNAGIDATITVNKGGKVIPLKVEGSGVNMGQIASDANYQLAYSRAFDDFLVNLDKSLTAAGL